MLTSPPPPSTKPKYARLGDLQETESGYRKASQGDGQVRPVRIQGEVSGQSPKDSRARKRDRKDCLLEGPEGQVQFLWWVRDKGQGALEEGMNET